MSLALGITLFAITGGFIVGYAVMAAMAVDKAEGHAIGNMRDKK